MPNSRVRLPLCFRKNVKEIDLRHPEKQQGFLAQFIDDAEVKMENR